MDTIYTADIGLAADYLRFGEVVAFPTETVYGLGAIVSDKEAIQRIYKVKSRPYDNPFIIHIAEIEDIYRLSYSMNEITLTLIQKFFPGSLTLILPKNPDLPEYMTSGLDTVAIRLPQSKIARELIRLVGMPIAATSANVSGRPSATQYHHVRDDLHNKIPCVLMGDASEYGLESTVVDCSQPGEVSVLRTGSISLESIQESLLSHDVKVQYKHNDGSTAPISPGLKYPHYKPNTSVKILSSSEDIVSRSFSYIGLAGSPLTKAVLQMDCIRYTYICNDLQDYASNIYAFLRDSDKKQCDVIYCESPPSEGIGVSIYDRLQKASQ